MAQRLTRSSDHGIFPTDGRLPDDAGALPRQSATGDRSWWEARSRPGLLAASGVIQLVREGRLKGLAVSNAARGPRLHLICRRSGGRISGISNSRATRAGCAGGDSEAVAALLEREVLRSLADPELQERFRARTS